MIRSRIALFWRATEERLGVPPAVALTLASVPAAGLLGICLGPTPMSPLGALRVALAQDHPLHVALCDVRLPRVAAGLAVGAALATAGAVLQALVRNPLADAGVLGVTQGAGALAVLALVLYPAHAELVPFAAFAGGLGTLAVLLALAASSAREVSPLRLVLSGVALQALGFALIALQTFLFADRAPAFAAFVSGSLNGLGWREARAIAPIALIGLGAAIAASRALDLMLLDDASAAGRGLHVRRSRLIAAVIAAFLAAGAVSVAGLVSFVGLVVPNALRLTLGPRHRVLLPLSAAGGAALVASADALARTLFAPLELPVGALLAALGGPYLLYLMWRMLP